jgi:hypothetical protein
VSKAIEIMQSHGVIIVDPVNITEIDNHRMAVDLWSLFLITFPEDIATYLAELSNTTMRTLTDLIEFNLNHSDEEFHPQFAPNQKLFELSNKLANSSTLNQSSLLNKTRQWAQQLCIDAV